MELYLVYYRAPNDENVWHAVFDDKKEAMEYFIEVANAAVNQEFTAFTEAMNWFYEHSLDEIYPGRMEFIELNLNEKKL